MPNGLTRHLSIRVPWHDHGWDGTICQNPKTNTSCLAVSLIAELRDDPFEQDHAGQKLEDLAGGVLPPCVRERGAFLAGRPISLPVVMPYSTWSQHHEHILPTTVQLPAYGGVMVPYRWMLREPAQLLARDIDIDLNLEREPQPPLPDFMVHTAWLQEVENQRAMLEAFAKPLEPRTSLIFFYARRTPLSDGAANPIVAVALLEHKGKVDEYPYKGGASGGRVQSMVWERPFQHSLRRTEEGWTGGVVLPYQEILTLAETDLSIEPGDYLAFAPEEARDQFLYGSEHVDHGSAIATLQAVRTSIERIGTLVPGRWADAIEWIDARINELWRLRGPAPGLGSALSCLQPGAFNGTLFAHALAPSLGDNENPWPKVSEIFAGTRPVPIGAPQLTGLQRKRFDHLRTKQPDQFELMQMLSRFEVTKEQALAAFETDQAKAFVRNPYEMFQQSRITAQPIGLGTIDRGLYNGGSIKGAWPLPMICIVNTDEPDDTRRLLAATIQILEEAAADGHTLLSADAVSTLAADLPLAPPVPIDAITLELVADDFNPEVDVTENDNGWFGQLDRFIETGEVIRRAMKARLGVDPQDHLIDWRSALDAELDAKADATAKQRAAADPLEQAARKEKAIALAQLASSRIAVLLGPAGSGKTTLLKVLLDHDEVVGNDIALLAPTGKARVRLGAQTGRTSSARTLAQFLLQYEKWDPETGAYSFPRAGPTAPVTTCIVDEASMLTEEQLAALLSTLPATARLVLVGDPRQLPPIGAGRPFVDLIAHLEAEAHTGSVARLHISRRQTVGGEVSADTLPDVQLASLFAGTSAGPGEDEIAGLAQDGDASGRLRLVEWDTTERLREKLAETLAAEFDCSLQDLERSIELSLGSTQDDRPFFNVGAGKFAENWQILTPHRDMRGGSADLNRHVKRVARANRLLAARKRGWGWRMIEPRGPDEITYGDKVICLRNHPRYRYSHAEKKRAGYLANGEVGIVVGQTGEKPVFTNVEFATQPGETFGFGKGDFSDHTSPPLELGYAVTIHKAQGSEFTTTFLVLPASSRLLSRELLYTALTRQRDRLWILHQGPVASFLRFRSDFHSETARRVTNLFVTPKLVEITPPPGEPAAARRTFLEDKLIHATRRGDLVSSKSEIVIADILHELEQEGLLRYTYEKPKMLGGTLRWPDFTIEAGSNIWYWEHCGMLDQQAYCERWERKKAGYVAEGLTIWSAENPLGRLIVTEDGPSAGLDSGALHALASQLFA
ncbi:MAG: hypothetical protein B7Y43_08870 [Sphingomonas sp. 28-62-20]|uniref:ATP-dependent DNA helicase n=1 Tax=Sphingomonas sp. 28-62-20 TaxID=1970433 RepID=UPI000BD1D34D|nr:MAG: hypothetical protein B7Y43_08870 [Sphingomonas sp. 28-62-20]